MRTVRTKVFKFNELTDEAKERAIDSLYSINVSDTEWWDGVYMDAAEIGLKLEYFDLDRNRHCTGEFISDAYACATKIVTNHGAHCATYKTAAAFMYDYDQLVVKYSDGIETNRVHEDMQYYFGCDADELEAEFLKSLLEDYSIMLQKEYEYLVSEEAIIETIEANDYEFTKEGNIF